MLEPDAPRWRYRSNLGDCEPARSLSDGQKSPISGFIGTVVPEESGDRELRGQAPVYTFIYTHIERGIAVCAD